jgi:type I restriction enzyme S subunit
VPTPPLQNQFGESIRPLFNQIDVLMEQHQKLSQARDLLLPRLMSGKIAV